jgi:phosphosulfolactate synthase
MPRMSFDFISVPHRAKKPRETGITMVLDNGLGLTSATDLAETAGEYVDIMKLGWGTSKLFSEEKLSEKVRAYHSADILVSTGGTFSEIAFAQKKTEKFLDYAKKIGFDIIEISNGVVPMNSTQKADYIRAAASKGFRIVTEVGKKSPKEDARLTVEQRVNETMNDLKAGAWKVIMEARASGKLGIYDSSGEVREDMVGSIVKEVKPENLLFEAPMKKQQIWLIKHFSVDVNLGNIKHDDIIPLETLRLGLRGDTLPWFHL